MLFVFLFVVGMLIVPVMIDIHKHGRNNVLVKTGEDIVRSRPVAGCIRLFSSTALEIRGVTASAFGLSTLLIGLYFFLWLFDVLAYVFALLVVH